MYALRAMPDKLAEIVGQVRIGTEAIATASGQIASGTQDLSVRTEEQACSLERTAAAMAALTDAAKRNTEHSLQANELAQTATAVAVKGGAVAHVVDTMGSINESSQDRRYYRRD